MSNRSADFALIAGNLSQLRAHIQEHWSDMPSRSRAGLVGGLAGFALLEILALSTAPLLGALWSMALAGASLLCLSVAALIWAGAAGIRYGVSFRQVLRDETAGRFFGMSLWRRFLLAAMLLLAPSTFAALISISAAPWNPPAALLYAMTLLLLACVAGIALFAMSAGTFVTLLRANWQRRDTMLAVPAASLALLSTVLLLAVTGGHVASGADWAFWAVSGGVLTGLVMLLMVALRVEGRGRRAASEAPKT